jgi:hypothetical protein
LSANTPKAGLTYPSLSDAPNVPQNLNTLATQLDGIVIPKYASASAQTAANTTPTAGDLCFRSDLKAYQTYDGAIWNTVTQGSWNTYTPVWSAATTAPAIGNGTITGRYTIVGKMVTAYIFVQFGSTTTYGSGDWNFSVPFAAANIGNSNHFWPGSAVGENPAGAWYPSTGMLLSNSSTVYVITPSSTGATSARWAAASPLTWASGMFINIVMTYELP